MLLNYYNKLIESKQKELHLQLTPEEISLVTTSFTHFLLFLCLQLKQKQMILRRIYWHSGKPNYVSMGLAIAKLPKTFSINNTLLPHQ